MALVTHNVLLSRVLVLVEVLGVIHKDGDIVFFIAKYLWRTRIEPIMQNTNIGTDPSISCSDTKDPCAHMVTPTWVLRLGALPRAHDI